MFFPAMELIDQLDKDIANHKPEDRNQLIEYKDEIVAKNCTPNYFPKYITLQVAKLNKS